MDICILDFETFWSTTHSLSKMSPIAYVMHPDTEIISMAAKFVRDGKAGDTQVIFGEDNIKNICSRIDWSNTWVIAHNNEGFDSMLCAWRLGIKPKMWGCTLAMARPIHAKQAGGSLAKLVAHYDIGTKDATALHNTKGRHLKDFSPEEIAAMGEYNKADVDQCYALFRRLIKVTPKDELKLIDMTIRMLVEPKFEVDRPLLVDTLAQVKHEKAEMLRNIAESIGVNTTILQTDEQIIDNASKILASSAKFSELLRSRNVEVPTKISPTTGKEAPALAKTDEAFIALQEHPDPVVSTAAQARLGVKSTLLETRIQAFLDAADATKGRLPVPLKYYGADTTGRWSGWAYNPQNLPRVGKKPKPSDALRNSIRAPKGHMVVVADLSGIELRVNHFLWKVPSSMALFQADPEKADLYKDFASNLYNKPAEDVTKDERQVGKVAHLGLGFGAGAATFRKVAKLMAGIDLSEGECVNVVNMWREEYSQIAQGWRTCHDSLTVIGAGKDGYPIDPWGMCIPCAEGIRTPKGLIRYPNLRKERTDEGKEEWVYGEGRHKARIYAGKITENCLAEGTLVLTDKGWKPIEAVSRDDLVHDGDSFVGHAGMVFKSVQPCVTIDGVYMTADHEVLDEHGEWKEASQIPRPYRPAIRSADRLASVTQRRAAMVLDVPLHLRGSHDEARAGCHQGTEARRYPELRVPNKAADQQGELHPRYDTSPSVRCLALYDRPMPSSVAQSMEKLRSAWHRGMRTMAAFVRELLGGHGAVVPEGAGLGSQGQQRGVLARELPMGFPTGKYTEQAQQPYGGYTYASEGDRHFQSNPVLSTPTRVAANRATRQAQGHKVYDILNAGPKHRFVVLGENGPFIVHNCVQHLARCVIADNCLEIKKQTGYSPALLVHDEWVGVVPEADAERTLATVQAIMRTPPVWWPELVTWSAGDIAETYGAAK